MREGDRLCILAEILPMSKVKARVHFAQDYKGYDLLATCPSRSDLRTVPLSQRGRTLQLVCMNGMVSGRSMRVLEERESKAQNS